MGWLEGLLSGYDTRNKEIVAENARRAEEARGREEAIYWTLINHPNDDIADIGAAGLLESMRPQKRKGGFAGWLGEMQGSNTYAELKRFRSQLGAMQTPSTGGTLPTPPAPTGSAAQPTSSPTTGGPMATPVPAPPAFPSERAQRGYGATVFQPPFQARTPEEVSDVVAANEPVLFPTPYVGMGGLSTPPPAPSGQPYLEGMVTRDLGARGLQPAPEGPVVESVPYASMGSS